jgi:type II secretory pathway component GspD/PulD (secretin)
LIGRLATTGEVTINGSKVRSAEGLAPRLDLDQPISIDAKGANAAAFARVLSRVLGRRVEFASDTITGTMDLDAKDATVRDVLQHLARLGTVRIDGERLILADRRK